MFGTMPTPFSVPQATLNPVNHVTASVSSNNQCYSRKRPSGVIDWSTWQEDVKRQRQSRPQANMNKLPLKAGLQLMKNRLLALDMKLSPSQPKTPGK